MSENSAKKYTGLKVFLVLIIIVVVAFLLVKGFVIPRVKDAVAERVVEEMMKEAIEQSPDTASKIGDLKESIDQEDVEEVKKIIENKISDTNFNEIRGIVESGDQEALKRYADKNLTEDEKETLTDIYLKYK